jgi:guanine nucleotide-binding protein subunit beta-2-like 1 protein
LISSSWDKTLRLWDLKNGVSKKQFVGHDKEIFSVALSPDNRIIISGDADKKIKYWNILGDLKSTSDKYSHVDWVSSVRFSPQVKSTTKAQTLDPYFVSTGWDGRLKIWSLNFQIKYSFKAHEGNINHVAIAPNGKRIATGGKDKKLNIWDIMDL